jgi:hypothetical protein
MNVEAITRKSQRAAEDVAKKSERAFKAATEAAERALADLTGAASDLYDERKDDAEDLLREAGRTVGAAVGQAANSLVALLPSERRRRRRRSGMIVAGAVAVAIGLYLLRQARNSQKVGEESDAERSRTPGAHDDSTTG